MKKQKLSIGWLLSLCAVVCSASLANRAGAANQSIPQAEKVTMNEVTKGPAFITVDKKNPVPESNYNEWVRVALNMRNEDGLQVYRTYSDELGFNHMRYQQMYYNVPVEGGEYLEHVKNGIVVSTNGAFFSNINTDIIPALAEDKALQIGRA